MIVVKSCAIPAFEGWEELAEAGIVDQRFPAYARRAAHPVTLLERTDLPAMRAMLLDAHATPCVLS